MSVIYAHTVSEAVQNINIRLVTRALGELRSLKEDLTCLKESVVSLNDSVQGRRKRSGWSGFGRTNIEEKVGVFISRQHVGVAATAIVTQRCTTLKQRSFLERNTWGTLILGQADVPAV